jgi:hypothetical protein
MLGTRMGSDTDAGEMTFALAPAAKIRAQMHAAAHAASRRLG